ncbi:hypothetical protein AVEN_18096-1 [Araneus ventricosus]|uniref:Uncharacterized protein n=1 Tax=Araneus ventricosus TaxID=182803 RepID=A0A4Y1ZKI3_ARAVE|nr:hypothetical protein AVEN_18096-1 [Araneus ventricosus]
MARNSNSISSAVYSLHLRTHPLAEREKGKIPVIRNPIHISTDLRMRVFLSSDCQLMTRIICWCLTRSRDKTLFTGVSRCPGKQGLRQRAHQNLQIMNYMKILNTAKQLSLITATSDFVATGELIWDIFEPWTVVEYNAGALDVFSEVYATPAKE